MAAPRDEAVLCPVFGHANKQRPHKLQAFSQLSLGKRGRFAAALVLSGPPLNARTLTVDLALDEIRIGRKAVGRGRSPQRGQTT